MRATMVMRVTSITEQESIRARADVVADGYGNLEICPLFGRMTLEMAKNGTLKMGDEIEVTIRKL